MLIKRRLILINPIAKDRFKIVGERFGLIKIQKIALPPIALGYIAALTPDNWDVEIIDEVIEPVSFEECDLVGITSFTSNINRAYEIAKRFRELEIPVVMGGIHVSILPDEALQFADSVVIGEAESVWFNVIADVEANNLKSKYYGIRTNLKEMVSPRREHFYKKGYSSDTIQTSRGCPMDCEFCSISVFNGKQFRQRPVEEVIDELKTLKKKRVVFLDDNIVGYGPKHEERAIALAKGIIDANLKIKWYGTASMNIANNEEVLYWFRKSGCQLLFLGIESEDTEILQSTNKNVNIGLNYEDVFEKIHKHNIGIIGGFIFGFDGDTASKIEHRIKFILNHNIDAPVCSHLSPLPGTRLFERLKKEGRLLYTDFPSDWKHHDIYEEHVFMSEDMEGVEYKEMISQVIGKVYSHKQIIRKFIYTIYDTGSLLTAATCCYNNYITREFYKYKNNYRHNRVLIN